MLRIDIPPVDVYLQPSQPWDVVRNELSDGWEAVCDAIGVGAGEAESGHAACVDGTDDVEPGCEDREAQGWGDGRGPGVWVKGEDFGARLRCERGSLLGIGRAEVEAGRVLAVEDRNGFRGDRAAGGKDGGGREILVGGISLNSNGVIEVFCYAINGAVFAACRRIIAEDGVYAEGGGIDAAFRALNA